GEIVASGRVELLTGGFYEPILAILPDGDKRGQIQRLSEFLTREFGVRPRGMWLAERVWEPHLAKALHDAGVEYLAERRGRVPTLTVVDDGEKFGAWPGTHKLVYDEGWLNTFFDRVLSAGWLRMATFSDVLERQPATGRVYLPTASYQEMGEWALPAEAGRVLEEAKREVGPLQAGARVAGLLRGGFWRNFLVKYPEIAD